LLIQAFTLLTWINGAIDRAHLVRTPENRAPIDLAQYGAPPGKR
jgi:hypothetical protein